LRSISGFVDVDMRVPGVFSFSEFHISFLKEPYVSMVIDQSFLKFTNLPIAFLKTICVN